ncbi:TetR family transcriptional regulator [Seongchinamella sediminis]|uniref:TetR family transcriptional regulator n=1 Tax=Seongchinamella sediminis TaxID=2283635 RepID=A0A3L7DWV3_9GAMM|nr:TetR/AcrR family transcriptional regulator [Seongchinamella sediminis]RLQ22047.1 TetR family transcriptional regulator [Seongchinamella sediminis]
MTRAEPNKSRSRLEQRESDIMDAATGLFAKEGFHGTSTRKIAAAAGVSEGTLFHYFSTKNALLLAILDKFYGELIESAQDGMQEIMGTRERLLFLARNHLRVLMAQQALMLRLLQVYLSVDANYYTDYKNTALHQLNYRYTRIFDSVIREGMERGYVRADLELSAIRDLFFGGLEYGMRTLMGRNSSRKKIDAYVEVIVQPLWQSMQVASDTPPDAAAGLERRLELACERLENIADRLDKP